MLLKTPRQVRPFLGWILLGLVLLIIFSVLRASFFQEVGEEKRVWFELSFLLLAAVSAELLVVRLKQPTVMVLLLVGIVISPSAVQLIYPVFSTAITMLAAQIGLSITANVVPHLVSNEGIIRVLAQFGAILLLFKIGLHSQVSEIFNVKNFVVAFLGIIVPFATGFYFASLTGNGFTYAMFLGAAFTATSVGVTVAVLNELNLIQKEFAKIILGAAVIDDILALLVLSLITNFPTSLSPEALTPFLVTIGTALIFVVGGIKLGLIIVRKYFDKEIGGKISNQTFLGILAYVLAYAYIAEFIGLSAIVGAFVAGLTLNYSKLVNKLFDAFYPLEAVFTPLFFISLGMLIDIPALFANILPIIIITLLAVASKIVGCGLGAKTMGSSLKESVVIGFGMVPRGEIALIIALYGLTTIASNGESILSTAEYSIIASMAFLTTIIVPLFFLKAVRWSQQKKSIG